MVDMSRKNNRRNKKRANPANPQTESTVKMTPQKLDDVRGWLMEMRTFTDKAISLAGKLDGTTLSAEDDLFWALVKYAENVQESIKQLDDLNRSIFPVLEEIPIQPLDGSEMTWQGFKKMRDVLAHQFRNLDPKILWAVVTEEFPELRRLLDVLVVGDGVVEKGNEFNLSFRAGLFRNLPSFDPEGLFSPGNSIVGLLFDNDGKAQCMRFSRITDGSFRMDSSRGYEGLEMRVSLVGDEGIEQLGRWKNLQAPAVTKGASS